MKNKQKIIYILLCLSVFTSCMMQAELDSIQPNSVQVKQGAAPMQNQSTLVEYGTLRILKDSVTKSYTLTNTGEQMLYFSQITSDSPDFFVKLEKDTVALLPKQSLKFSVTFAPKLGGTTIGKISFSTNDPAFPVFSFGVKGQAVAPPEIIGSGSPQFNELNTVDLGTNDLGEDLGNATRFTIEINIDDPYDRINASGLSVKLVPIFSNGDRPEPITKTPSEITLSEDKKRLIYSIPIQFGSSTFLDIETTLILSNGDVSNVFTTRVEKPAAAE
ncbi:hypothetical protein V9L05_03645 [Bernardetia sp. Wsw4-3y2]|uniref:Ig-like domain-containing protein n=1 Tax=Bernardetia sp. Wsw4-3y2 TaxID=3127471 RepID=UPI0030CF9E1C